MLIPLNIFFLLIALCAISANIQAVRDSEGGVAAKYETLIESQTPQILATIKQKALKDKVSELPSGKIMEWVALQLLDKPYVAALLDKKKPEYLYISLNQTDCMLFVEEVLVLTRLIKNQNLAKNTSPAQNIQDFTNGIKNVRYHGDVSYCQRNHYFKDWALVNHHKDLVIDAAYPLTKAALPYKAEILSTVIAKPTSLHNDSVACIKDRETLLNQQQLGFIKLSDLPKYLPKIQSGDIIGIVREPNGKTDAITHLGIAYVHNSKVDFINASNKPGNGNKVVITSTLANYLAGFKDSRGIILLSVQ